MRVLVSGDTHGDMWLKKLDLLAKKHCELTKQDVLICLGDSEIVKSPGQMSGAEHRRLHKYMDYPWTTLVIDGNHDNMQRLTSLPCEQIFSGEVGRIHPGIFYLQRGHIYNINGLNTLVYGGAQSLKRELRTFGVDIWNEEVPTKNEFETTRSRASKTNIDCLLSHTCSGPIKTRLPCNLAENNDPTSSQLEQLYNEINPPLWFFGHFHIDWQLLDADRLIACCHDEVWEIDVASRQAHPLSRFHDNHTFQTRHKHHYGSE